MCLRLGPWFYCYQRAYDCVNTFGEPSSSGHAHGLPLKSWLRIGKERLSWDVDPQFKVTELSGCQASRTRFIIINLKKVALRHQVELGGIEHESPKDPTARLSECFALSTQPFIKCFLCAKWLYGYFLVQISQLPSEIGITKYTLKMSTLGFIDLSKIALYRVASKGPPIPPIHIYIPSPPQSLGF